MWDFGAISGEEAFEVTDAQARVHPPNPSAKHHVKCRHAIFETFRVNVIFDIGEQHSNHTHLSSLNPNSQPTLNSLKHTRCSEVRT
jgi:hypothetical protein